MKIVGNQILEKKIWVSSKEVSFEETKTHVINADG